MRDRTKALYAAFVGNIDSQALVPVVALYALALGADLLMVGLVVGAYSLVHAPANVAFGHLVDRFGRRRTLVVGLLADAVSLAFYALATSPAHLLGARVLHGLGGGLVGPASMSAVADSAPRGGHGRTMALYGISLGLSVLVGFGLAGGLVLAGGGVREAVPRLAAVLVAFLATGAIVGAGLGEAPVRARPGRPEALALLRKPEVFPALVLMASLYFGIGAFVAVYPVHMTERLGAGAERTVVLSFVAFAVTSVLLHYGGGLATDRLGPRVVAVAGLSAFGSGFLLLPLAASPPANLGAMVLLGAGHALTFPAASAAVAAGAPRDRLGLSTGLLYASLVLGAATGAPVLAAAAGAVGPALALALTPLAFLPAIAIGARFLRAAGTSPPKSR